jgi:uncharacterized protein YjiS (DUF1127 family)
MIMSQSTTLPACREAGGGTLASLGTAVQHLFAAYIAWRMERTAIAALSAMSDRALSDIGLTRAEIASAVKGSAARPRAA